MNIEFKGKKTNYQLTHDRIQYILSEETTVKTGKRKGQVIFKPIGFYPKIEQILNKVFDLEISDPDSHSFAELFAAVTDAREFIGMVVSKLAKTNQDAIKC